MESLTERNAAGQKKRYFVLAEGGMIQRVLQLKNLIACILAAGTGLWLHWKVPFPEENFFLELTYLWAQPLFLGFKYCYTCFLFTTPYIAYSVLLSGIYIFTLKFPRRIRPGHLPAYPDPRVREDLFLVIGEVHNPQTPGPSACPHWLIVPERGLFTGIAIFGAIGSGKTSCCILPFVEQMLAYRASEQDRKIGGLVLEVKGHLCHQDKRVLEPNTRVQAYVEISLASGYRYNPLHNDLDSYALAYSIASLLNNLFGKGKEPFWQQAYTNLVKFIILLHKVAYDYVTLFDVYECAIAPEVLESKIHDAERRLEDRYFVAVTPNVYGNRAEDLAGLGFAHDAKEDRYLAPATPELRQMLRKRGIPFESRSLLDPTQADPDKLEQLEAVKRWFND